MPTPRNWNALGIGILSSIRSNGMTVEANVSLRGVSGRLPDCLPGTTGPAKLCCCTADASEDGGRASSAPPSLSDARVPRCNLSILRAETRRNPRFCSRIRIRTTSSSVSSHLSGPCTGSGVHPTTRTREALHFGTCWEGGRCPGQAEMLKAGGGRPCEEPPHCGVGNAQGTRKVRPVQTACTFHECGQLTMP